MADFRPSAGFDPDGFSPSAGFDPAGFRPSAGSDPVAGSGLAAAKDHHAGERQKPQELPLPMYDINN